MPLKEDLGLVWPSAKNRFVCSTQTSHATEWEPASRHVGVPAAPDTNELTTFYRDSTSLKKIYATSSTHTHTLRKSLHPRLHQSSPVADELPSSPRLITSLLSLAANQAQRRERGRDSEVEKQWSLSLLLFPLHFQFSLIFLSPQGEVEGGLIAREGGPTVSPHNSHLLIIEREKKKKKKRSW